MQGVGPGTVLGGRYAARNRLARTGAAERWSAHDTTLERDVELLCLPASHQNASAVLDAARRAAGVDNPHLVRILDVGTSDAVAYVVEERSDDAQTLAELLQQGGLPAEEVRRVAGEVCTALEAASHRGLHHLALDPAMVLRRQDGSIKVTGLATAAALAGSEDLESAQAARTDAVGVAALVYAGLTSRWPLPGDGAGLEPAPRVVGGIAAPSEIAAGVPGDLDALCRLTLSDNVGPVSPGDFAAQIAPWSPTQVGGGAVRSNQRRDLAGAGGVEPTLVLPVVRPGEPGLPGRPERRGGAAPGSGPAPGGGAAQGGPNREQRVPAGAARLSGATAVVGGAVGSALGSAGQAAGGAVNTVGNRVGTFAKAAADKAAERKAAREAAEADAERNRISLDDALLGGQDDLEPPLPLLPAQTAQTLPRKQSTVAIAIIAGFLAVVTALALWGVSHIGSNTHLLPSLPAAPKATTVVTAPPTPVTHSATSSTSTAAATAIPIKSATGFDPQGDGAERNSEADRVFDGNPDTFWSSEGYASADLGGLKKGVGVIADFGAPVAPKRIALTLPDAADVTVYLADDSSLQGATKVGTSSGKSGVVTMPVKGTVKGRYLIVWFTKLSQVSDGRYRATLAEISVTG